MIELTHFKQAYQLYQSNQLSPSVIQDLALIFLYSHQSENPPIVNHRSEISIEQLEWLSMQNASEFLFEDYLGGNAYICEFERDLTAINAYDQNWFNQYGVWPNVTDKAMQWDVCMTLNEAWAVFAYCWNNAGGNLYYIPSHLWQKAKVNEHLHLNQG